MKKAIKIIYVVICVAFMSLPFAGMLFAKTETTTENKRLAELPELVTDDGFNKEYLAELGEYFNDHFAFRNYFVDADSRIQSGVFQESNVDTVAVGTDGWLYYTATVDNFLGQNLMSERERNNCIHNIKLLQDYVENRGAEFVLAVPPNKNTLYGDNMPYYDRYKVSGDSDMTALAGGFAANGVNYADLYDVMKSQGEVMYLKRDSHWNNMGALLAYGAIMEKTDHEYETYETAKLVRRKDYIGDLNSMVYPISSEPEWNVYMDDSEWNYEYTTDSVEDLWIETENAAAEGTLLMFRDSFGNTLLPYMANTFGRAQFSKNIPYNIASYMNEYNPDVVVVEKVERNVSEFGIYPPVFEGPETELDNVTRKDAEASITVCEAESNIGFWQIDGIVDEAVLGAEGVVCVGVAEKDRETVYEAFGLTAGESDYGFRLYLDKTSVKGTDIDVTVYVSGDDGFVQTITQTVDLTQVETLN